jgi:hypothetical protein
MPPAASYKRNLSLEESVKSAVKYCIKNDVFGR